MNLSILLLVLGILYIYLSFIYKHNENFENKRLKGTSQESIFDEFYVFMLDDLFYKSDFYKNFGKIILHYSNSVYNNHLCIGIKHGGHINELLKNNTTMTTITKSKPIVDLCKFNYKDNNYKFIDKYESNSYIFNEHEFTHISLIDNEVYYTQNLNGMMYNVTKWISNRGYLFIDVFQNINNLKQHFVNKDNGEFIKLNYKYSEEIKNVSNNKFYFNEHIKLDDGEKVNSHELTFYSIEYLKFLGNECGLTFVKYYDVISSVDGRGVLVFQKI
tara:strand:- start:6461 stop:7279 length:819 start_codon:yes stop_codon:yes gene_type:complete